MEKLVKRFEELMIVTPQEKELHKLGCKIVPSKCAEEARKIAIEYRWWWGNKTVKVDISECPDDMDFEDWVKIWEQGEFNNFINEYYEKTKS